MAIIIKARSEIVGKSSREATSGPHIDSQDQKSWQTSHLPELPAKEMQVLLDIIHCWYNQDELHVSKKCNWPVLWEYIDRHGLSGMAGSLVLDDLASFPEEINQAATHRYFSNQLYYEQAIRCCSMVQEAAQKLNIPVIALKGPAIVFQGYKDQGTRSFCDIDLFSNCLESVHQLRNELCSPLIKASANQSCLEKLGESECVSFQLKNWELEFRYPLDPPGEPMFEVLAGNSAALFKVPELPEDIINPDPSVHLVFLLQHMAIHHLFSRFFWFLDLAVLIREQQTHIDLEFVERELDRIGQRNCMAVASSFCRKYIDPDFPIISPKLPAWNYAMMNQFINPQHIANGRFGIYHKNLWETIMGYIYGVIGFYIIEDPIRSFFSFGFGTKWTIHRLRNSFGIKSKSRVLAFFVGSCVRLTLYPFARLVSLLTCLRNKG